MKKKILDDTSNCTAQEPVVILPRFRGHVYPSSSTENLKVNAFNEGVEKCIDALEQLGIKWEQK